MSKLIYRNAVIENAGIRFCAHLQNIEVRIYGDSWNVTIPMNAKEMSKFTDIFPEINWEDGEFINKITNSYVRIGYDEQFRIKEIKHIAKDLTYEVK